MQPLQYGYLEAFVDELRSRGRYTFTLDELRDKYELSNEALKKALQRLIKKKEATRIRQEFYVIVPPEYRQKGVLPTSLFIADLMKFLQKDYYVGLLSAASLYGAAHQQPQAFFVITTKPTLRPITSNRFTINFFYKKEWSQEDINQRKVETGYLKVSSPELTAFDLVAYFDRVGGLNRTATILEELSETLNDEQLVQTAKHYGQISVIQRLGYLFEEVLGKKELVEPLATYLKSVKHFPVLLRPQKNKPVTMITGNKWKVVANTEIEIDV